MISEDDDLLIYIEGSRSILVQRDTTSNANDASIVGTGGIKLTRSGYWGMDCPSGFNGYSIPYSSELNISGDVLSLSLWLYPRSWDDSGSATTISDFFTKYAGYYFGIDTATATIRVYWYGVTSAWQYSSSPIDQFVWTHLAIVFDGTDLHFYFNGVLDVTRTGISGSATYSSNGEIRIGQYSGRTFDGMLKNIRLYKRVLSPEEVKAIYTKEYFEGENWLPDTNCFKQYKPATALSDYTPNWRFKRYTDGTAGDVYVINNTTYGKVLHIDKIADTTSVRFYDYPQRNKIAVAGDGIGTIEFDFWINGTSCDLYVVIFNTGNAFLQLWNYNVSIRNGNTGTTIGYYTKSTWTHVTVDYNVVTGKFDVDWGGTALTQQSLYSTTSASRVSRFQCGSFFSGGGYGDIYIKNIKWSGDFN